MPGDLRKVSLLAVVLIVLLRISIGWHLMYEGLWKISTQKTSTPWTSEGYLKNSTGPFREKFRAMTGDPDDLKWLDAEAMAARWKDWRDQFVAHYQLDEDQKSEFDRLMSGVETYEVGLAELPPGLDLGKVDGVNKNAIKYNAEAKKLVVDGKLHLLPIERDRLIAAATELAKANAADTESEANTGDEEAKKEPKLPPVTEQFIAAVKRVYTASSRLSFNDQLAAVLKGDPERVGVILQGKGADKAEGEAEGQTPVVVVVGEVDYYKELVTRFNANYAKARTKTEWEHIEEQWKELQTKRRELVGPVQAVDKEMKEAAEDLLNGPQLLKGPVPLPMTEVQQIDSRTMWGLTIFGLLLMIGLFTRLSAVGGAFLLMMFYLAMPPWPGVQEIPSIEHNLFVNKVLVEMLALLAIAALPSGKWFGVDAAISALFTRTPKK